jgi:6-phosphogluconate dehydrogenase
MSEIENTDNKKSVLGMIGLGTMGRNLLLNMTDHGYAVSGFDVDPKMVALLKKDSQDASVKGIND